MYFVVTCTRYIKVDEFKKSLLSSTYFANKRHHDSCILLLHVPGILKLMNLRSLYSLLFFWTYEDADF